MTPQPFANLFAFSHRDAALLAAVRKHLELSGAFAEVFSPHWLWVVGIAPLPETTADSAELRARGFVFAEGREAVEAQLLKQDPRDALLSDLQVAALPGDFTFLQFAPDGTALAVRSVAGQVPMYHAVDGESAMLTTSITLAARFHPREFTVDKLTLGLWMSRLVKYIGDGSLLQGITSVAFGSLLRLHPGTSADARRYWFPPDVEPLARNARASQQQEYAEAARRILIANLERDLDPHGRNVLLLSGGVDSSALAALTTRDLGIQYAALSFLSRTPEVRRRDESYLYALQRELGFQLQAEQRPSAEERIAIVRSAPACLAPMYQYVYSYLPAYHTDAGPSVVLNGHFADLFFDSRGAQTDDLIALSSPVRLLRCRSARVSRRRLLHAWVAQQSESLTTLRAPPIPVFLAPELRQAIHRRARAAIRPTERGPRPFRGHLHGLVMSRAPHLSVFWEVGSALRLRNSSPFLSRATLELCYRIDPLHHLPGPKELLAKGLAGVVPMQHLLRPDKGREPPHSVRAMMETPIDWEPRRPVLLGGLLAPPYTGAMPVPFGDALHLEVASSILARQCVIRLKRPPARWDPSNTNLPR